MSPDPSRGRLSRPLALLVAGALAGGGLVALPVAAQAATADVSGVTFDWGINAESNGGAYFGGCNFLSAGTAGDTGSARTWTEADGFYRATDGNATLVRPTADGAGLAQPTWATKCQTPSGTTVNGKTTAAADSTTQTRVQIADGSGTVDVDANTAEIAWDGSFTVAYYGGMTYWTATDPVLTVAADGTGTVTADLSGYGADMDDSSVWTALPVAEDVVIASLTGVEVTAEGIEVTPDYLGVVVPDDVNGRNPQDTSQEWSGAFPAGFLEYQVLTGQSSYWYSTAGGANSIQPRKVTLPLTVDYSVPLPVITTQPAAQEATLGEEAVFAVEATDADAYQWQTSADDGATWTDVSGATGASHAVTATSAAGALLYRVVLTGANGSVASDAAALTVDVPTPTVTVSKTEGLDPDGETITIRGTGFLPNAPATTGTRPPLAGSFTGAYVTFGRFADVWQPSAGAASSARAADRSTTRWAVHEAQVATIGGTSAGAIVIDEDGTFETTITVKAGFSGEPATGNYGIYTYPGGGASYAAFETATPVSFDFPVPEAPAAASTATGTDPRSVVVSWQAPASEVAVTGYDVTLTPSEGDAITQSVAADATSATFTGLTPGVAYTASVVAQSANGPSVAATADAVTVPEVVSAVAVTGTAAVGRTLTAAPALLDGATVTGYQWKADGAAVSGATSRTFTPAAAQRGTRLTVTVTATAPGYDEAGRTSAATAKVAAGTLAAATPTVQGTARVGVQLKAVPGSWTAGVTRTYQWFADGKAVSGATSYTFTPKAAQKGKTITVKVTGTKAGYTTVVKGSAKTKAVAAGVLTAPTPTIAGTAKVGVKLTAKPGAWTSATTLRYQWFADGKAVSGATSSTFTPKAAQKGKTITVKVTGSKAGYATVVKGSAKTKAVAG